MHSTRLIFTAKKHLTAAILKSNLRKRWYFQISQKFFWMETDTQKWTKSNVQPRNHCSLKIYQSIYIDHKGYIALHVGWLLWQKHLNTAI